MQSSLHVQMQLLRNSAHITSGGNNIGWKVLLTQLKQLKNFNPLKGGAVKC